MIHKNLYVNIVIRVILLTVTCLAFSFIYLYVKDILILLNILLLIVIQAYLIIYKLNKINRDLTGFFAAIQNDDSSIIYQRMAPYKSYSNLYKSFDDINNRIRKLKIESITKNQYLQNIVDHVGIGLLSFDDNDNIDILNNAARNIFNISGVRKLSRLEKVDMTLPVVLRELKPGEQKLIKIRTEDELLQLAVKASVFKMEGKTIKLISLQNIINELEEKELESWQKLIRILTHEIMNSISPISSSIKTIKEFLTQRDNKKTISVKNIKQELIDDSVKGLNIIEERSDGLVDFVEKFRSLTLLTKPVFKKFPVKELFESIKLLMAKEVYDKKINLEIEVIPESLILTADKKLVEQILINLINNSIQAFENINDREIILKAFCFLNNNAIQVVDNGNGINEENMDKIFIPFFTTKKGGSGIGLSLSREIMRLHKGKIRVKSIPGKETIFTLEF